MAGRLSDFDLLEAREFADSWMRSRSNPRIDWGFERTCARVRRSSTRTDSNVRVKGDGHSFGRAGPVRAVRLPGGNAPVGRGRGGSGEAGWA